MVAKLRFFFGFWCCFGFELLEKALINVHFCNQKGSKKEKSHNSPGGYYGLYKWRINAYSKALTRASKAASRPSASLPPACAKPG